MPPAPQAPVAVSDAYAGAPPVTIALRLPARSMPSTTLGAVESTPNGVVNHSRVFEWSPRETAI